MLSWLVVVESNTTGSGRLFCLAARGLGLRPIVLCRDPARYPYLVADGVETRTVDTGDVSAVHQACAALPGRVAGVTSSSEYFIPVAAEAARGLSLPGPEPTAVAVCRDKVAQRNALRAAGLPVPAFAAAATVDEAVRIAAAVGYPVVVKPTAGSGSVDVRQCGDAGEVAAAAAAVLASGPEPSGRRRVLIEEYLDGPEFSVETADARIVGITSKHLGPEPYFVETGHDFPAPVGGQVQRQLADGAVRGLSALGLHWGAAHVEMRLTSRGVRIVEVNPRLAGGMIPRIIQEASGVDLVRWVVARAAGQAADPAAGLRPVRTGAAAIRFLVPARSGRLVRLDGVATARRTPHVVDVVLTVRCGQEMRLTNSFQDRIGYVIAAAADLETAVSAAERARSAVSVDLL